MNTADCNVQLTIFFKMQLNEKKNLQQLEYSK